MIKTVIFLGDRVVFISPAPEIMLSIPLLKEAKHIQFCTHSVCMCIGCQTFLKKHKKHLLSFQLNGYAIFFPIGRLAAAWVSTAVNLKHFKQ